MLQDVAGDECEVLGTLGAAVAVHDQEGGVALVEGRVEEFVKVEFEEGRVALHELLLVFGLEQIEQMEPVDRLGPAQTPAYRFDHNYDRVDCILVTCG